MLRITLLLALVCFAASYDYLVFTSEWVGTICKRYHCDDAEKIDTQFFNIHGLWPTDDSNDRKPSRCGGVKYNRNDLSQQTQEDIDAYWSGLYSGAYGFHSHEWEEHGSCWSDPNQDASSTSRIEDYFSTVIKIAKQYNLYDILSKAGISPRNGYYYSSDKVVEAIEQSLNIKNFKMTCDSDSNLSSVSICLDDQYSPMECPRSQKIECGSRIYYPEYESKSEGFLMLNA